MNSLGFVDRSSVCDMSVIHYWFQVYSENDGYSMNPPKYIQFPGLKQFTDLIGN